MERARVIAEAAAHISRELGAVAIMVSGDLNFEGIETGEIPVYYISMRPKSIIDHLVATSKDGKSPVKELGDQLTREASGNVEYVQHAAAIEYALEGPKNGIVVGVIETRGSSSIIVHNLDDNPLIKAMKECEERVNPEVMNAVLKIAFDIALTGREGKKIGAAFIVGDSEEVLKRSHQIILNPYEGHEEAHRNILDRRNWESIKEFALLDGVFVIDETGIVRAAGRYLDVDGKNIDIEKGLGGRHVSAAAISRDTVAISVTVSESGGVLRVYKDAKETICMESLQPASRYV
ncbi:MAG: diadenylate cyclase [Methanosarcina mazei]|jgi:DNA integrity scanning protein DisA with diadenylate cyclase activity|uniref:DNA integrity scanning protein DisA nucleotide-binding domain protein n=1 Tax=Methanosarcina soligelidi TaxID=1036677 RepID=UPI00064F7C1A|nr:diadenylate cyclase [Methanosarcina soligelidi]NLO30040.1 diadenylate cyclase [Methanosarcina mazei]